MHSSMIIFYCRPKNVIPILDPPKEREMKVQFNAVIRLDIWEWEKGNSSIYMRFGHKDLGNFEIDFGPCFLHRLAMGQITYIILCFLHFIEMLVMVFMLLDILYILTLTLSSHCGMVCHTNM